MPGITVPLPPLMGGGLTPGRTTGANALFCLTAEIILAGENEKIPGVVPDGMLVHGVVGGSVGD